VVDALKGKFTKWQWIFLIDEGHGYVTGFCKLDRLSLPAYRWAGVTHFYVLIAIEQTSPSNSLSIWRGSGAAVQIQTMFLPHHLRIIAQQ
jgi:hypothetical protein